MVKSGSKQEHLNDFVQGAQNLQAQALIGVFWLHPREKARFRPILTHFEAIFGLHLVARGPTGQLWAQKWGTPSEPTTYPEDFRWVSNSQGGLIHTLMGGLIQTLRGGLFRH